MKTSTENKDKILWTLIDIERSHTSTPVVSAVFAAFVLYLSHESPDETELQGILKSNQVSDTLRRAIVDRLGDHWNEYLPLLSSFMQSELAAVIASSAGGENLFGSKASPCYSSVPVADLAVRLLDLKPGDSVCDLGCATGDFIRRAFFSTVAEAGGNRLLGIDSCADAAAVAEIRMICEKAKVDILNESFFSKSTIPLLFDKVFCDPPLGLRGLPQNPEAREFLRECFPDFPELIPSMPGDWIFAARAVAAKKPGGRAVVTMPMSAVFDNRGEAFRRYFVRRNLVEAVVELPPRLFSCTNASTCLVVLSEGNESVKLVRADELAYSNRKRNIIGKSHADIVAACLGLEATNAPEGLDRYRAVVGRDTLLEGDCCLAPKRLFAPTVSIRDGIGLGSLVKEAKRGANIPARELDILACTEETPFLYIATGDINDGVLSARPTCLREIPPEFRLYCAKQGDILISRILANGAGFKSAVVETFPEKTVLPNANLWIVSVDRERTDPYFVKACLDSEYGQRFLSTRSSGASILAFGYRTLEEFPLPALPIGRQREIGAACRDRVMRFVELRDRLATAKKEVDSVFSDLAPDCIVKAD